MHPLPGAPEADRSDTPPCKGSGRPLTKRWGGSLYCPTCYTARYHPRPPAATKFAGHIMTEKLEHPCLDHLQ